MSDLNVQFADSSEKAVVSVFAGPQDPDEYPNQSVIADDDPRYLEFMTPKVDPVITDPVESSRPSSPITRMSPKS